MGKLMYFVAVIVAVWWTISLTNISGWLHWMLFLVIALLLGHALTHKKNKMGM